MPPIFSSTFLSPSDDISPFDSSSSTIPLGPGMTGLRSAENGEAAAVTRSERMDEERGRVRAVGEGGEDMVVVVVYGYRMRFGLMREIAQS
jgi:hypothetical protein